MPTTAAQMLRARALKILHQPAQQGVGSAAEQWAQLQHFYLQRLLTEGASHDEATAAMSRTMAYLQSLHWLEAGAQAPLATLENWQLLETEEGLKVRAQRYGQQGRTNGGVVTTSRLVALNSQQIQTRNSLYTLGTPQPGEQERLTVLSDLLGQLRFVRS